MAGSWWKELLRFPPSLIHVTSPRQCRRKVRGVRYHHARSIDRTFHRGLPVLSVTQLLVQLAPTASDAALRRAIAVADRKGELDRSALKAALEPGPRGAVRLRHALDRHMPQLADTLSPLEDRFLLFCETHRIPLPEVNVEVNGCTVDALWRAERLAVELDGREEHGTPAAVVRDRRREGAYRKANLDVIRYGSDQIDHDPEDTAADLRAALARR